MLSLLMGAGYSSGEEESEAVVGTPKQSKDEIPTLHESKKTGRARRERTALVASQVIAAHSLLQRTIPRCSFRPPVESAAMAARESRTGLPDPPLLVRWMRSSGSLD